MFFFKRTKKEVESAPPMQRTDRVTVALATDDQTVGPTEHGEVLRISSTEIRLGIMDEPSGPFAEGLQLHRRLDLVLPLPAPRPPAITRGRVVGITHNYIEGMPRYVIDVEFMSISDDEQKALCESHQGLLVS
ncbi:hypothetical protein GC173_06710 [bacterium]|nr:hypothetical protein [bacterium]